MDATLGHLVFSMKYDVIGDQEHLRLMLRYSSELYLTCFCSHFCLFNSKHYSLFISFSNLEQSKRKYPCKRGTLDFFFSPLPNKTSLFRPKEMCHKALSIQHRILLHFTGVTSPSHPYALKTFKDSKLSLLRCP